MEKLTLLGWTKIRGVAWDSERRINVALSLKVSWLLQVPIGTSCLTHCLKIKRRLEFLLNPTRKQWSEGTNKLTEVIQDLELTFRKFFKKVKL